MRLKIDRTEFTHPGYDIFLHALNTAVALATMDGVYELHLNSRDGRAISSGSELGSVLFKLKDDMRIPFGRMQIALGGGKIPRTFYTIDELNCRFTLTIDATTYTDVEIAHGNPTAYQVADEVQAALIAATGKAFVVSYSPRTNKYSISLTRTAETTLTLSFSGAMYRVLGFSNTTHAFTLAAGAFSLVSDNTGTLSSIPSCSIHLEGYHFEDALTTEGHSSILHRQYFRAAPNGYEVIEVSGRMDWKTCTVPAGSIGSFILSLKDSDGREIDFNGVDWELTLYIRPYIPQSLARRRDF